MKIFPSLILLIVCILPLHAQVEWHTDYRQVRSLSQQANKPMLLFFNGSDWAGAAMKLKHEVLLSSAFQEIIDSKLVCMEIDFPKHAPLPEATFSQNEELKERFKIQEPPTILLLDNKERIIARIDYLPENGELLASSLLKILEQDAELAYHLKDIEHVPNDNLKTVYQLAQELGNDLAIEKILEIGFKKEIPFFCLEKYRLLVDRGEMKSQEALALRQKLISFGPENEIVDGEFIPFTLTLIDFQELVLVNHEPQIAAKPLIEYLAHFAEKDQKNIWRIEMMIAELYLDVDKWDEALKHAERAYRAAPEIMHEEIAHSLDYIRSQNLR